jgi:hypothetical protein
MRRPWWIALAAAAALFVAAYMWTFGPHSGWKPSLHTEDWAQFGEYVGGVFAILAFVSVLATVEIQRRQLDLQRVQVTLDQLLRLAQDFATAIDHILAGPAATTAVTQHPVISSRQRSNSAIDKVLFRTARIACCRPYGSSIFFRLAHRL